MKIDDECRPKTILIVDDSVMTRTMVKEFLKKDVYRLIEASNGLEALNELKDSPIDLVITDIMMPDMNGFRLLEAMKEDHDEVEVIAMSGFGGYSMARSVLKGLKRIGVRNVLNKPFSRGELVALVESVI